MKEYDKEKLNEYAKELFALCLEKDIEFNITLNIVIRVEYDLGCYYVTRLDKEYYYEKLNKHIMPIWELIEKVKQL